MKHQQKHTVTLSDRKRRQLQDITREGQYKAPVIRRAYILLRSSQGETDRAIADTFSITTRTVENVRKRFKVEGMGRALYDLPRSGQPKKLDKKAESHLVALACTDPPTGADHWTLELLTERMIKDKKVKAISSVCIMHYLHRNNLKPWREKNVVHSKTHA
ncbi:MAG: helix-turn-helix domain-containing protein [bacterium]|nr:helix-turn-helix domain-containing protein [bacterium]